MIDEGMYKRKILEKIKNQQISPEEGIALYNRKSKKKSKHDLSIPLDIHNSPQEDSRDSRDIAIIGMSGQFPDAENVHEFWNNLVSGKDSVREIPPLRWNTTDYDDPHIQKFKWGGFLKNPDRFDPLFFNISPKEAELMDPQQRLILSETWKAIEDAGYSKKDLSEKKIGVFIGCHSADYIRKIESSIDKPGAFAFTGNATSILPARLSFLLNLKGSSLPIDTACSSSLVAIYLACESIWSGSNEMSIAGGVAVMTTPIFYNAAGSSQMLSPTGRCKVFDDGADGFVPGEGVGILLLKSLQSARKNKDHIYGVIKGAGLNQDGKSNGITAPSATSQTALECEVFDRYQIDPESISYVEAHGTGTKLGDPIEVNALTDAFQKYTPKKQFCAIGSVKSNIGHALTAAGMAGVIKILLCIKHKKLVPSIHVQKENQHINFQESPFYINTTLRDWKTEGNRKRRATVSSFGMSGTNAFLVIDEYVEDEGEKFSMFMSEKAIPSDNTPYLFVLSAKNENRLKAYAEKMLRFLDHGMGNENDPQNGLLEGQKKIKAADLAYTLFIGREAMEARLAIHAPDVNEFSRKLKQYIQRNTEINNNPPVNNWFENMAYGVVKLRQKKSSEIISEEMGDDLIRGLVQKRDFSELARLWVSGMAIEWEFLYSGPAPRRISLPTYPFLRDSYWINSADRLHYRSNETQSVHPLLDGVDPAQSLNKGIVFKKLLSRGETIVREHIVQENPTLPGVGYLEMAWVGFTSIKKDHPSYISRIFWLQPLLVLEDSITVYVSIEKEEDHEKIDKHRFDIRSKLHDQIIHHATGEFYLTAKGEQKKEIEIVRMSMEEIRNRCTHETSREDFYAKIRNHGVRHGHYFQGLQKIWSNEKEALGLLRLPEECEAEFDRYTFHPTLLDSAIQTISGVQIASSFHGEDYPDTIRRPVLPYSIEKLEMFHPIKNMGYTYAQIADNNRYHIAILDETGLVCAKLHDVTLREVKDPLETFFYALNWKEQPLAPPPRTVQSDGQESAEGQKRVLLIYPSNSLGIEKILADVHSTDDVFEIELGLSSTEEESENRRVIDARDPSAMDCVMDWGKGIDLIYFLGGIQSGHVDYHDLETLANSQACGVLSLFRFVKILSEKGFADRRLLIKVITNDVHAVFADQKIRPFAASLHGFTRSMAREYPNWTICNIDISLNKERQTNASTVDWITMVLDEQGTDSGKEVAIREGRRYVREIIPTYIFPDTRMPFRKHGVYLILGGTGGIGLTLSEYLAETVQAKLILIGRNPLNSMQNEKIFRMESKGAEVIYLLANATNPDQMKAAVAKAKYRFGRINGVIHSAIVLQDKIIRNMDEETFVSALAPKVTATLVLHKVFSEEPIDFMIFFSSIQSFTCNAGQSNYAAGSTFKDAFAHWLDQNMPYDVRVINWGYWGDVGVVSSDDYNKRLTSKGLLSIHPKEGMTVVQRILSHRIPQLIAMKATDDLLDVMEVEKGHRMEIFPMEIPSMMHTLAPLITALPEKKKIPEDEQRDRMFLALASFGRSLLLSSLQKIGIFQKVGQVYDKNELEKELNIRPVYRRLYNEILDILSKAGFIQFQDGRIITHDSAESHGLQWVRSKNSGNLEKKNLVLQYPDIEAHINLLWICLENLSHILTGRTSATDIFFPKSSLELIEGIYRGNIIPDHLNLYVAQSVRMYIEGRLSSLKKDETICILEIGAGTGSTSTVVLDAVSEFGNKLRYMYTDISNAFVYHGEKTYGSQFDFMEFQILDIEKPVNDQGFRLGNVDVIIATNVLHATRKLDRTLGHVQSLLKTNGWLVLNEIIEVAEFSTLTFGMLEGWWLFEDPENRLKGSPLSSPDMWIRLMRLTGFKRPLKIGCSKQIVLIAESSGQSKIIAPSEDRPSKDGSAEMARKMEKNSESEPTKTSTPPKVAWKSSEVLSTQEILNLKNHEVQKEDVCKIVEEDLKFCICKTLKMKTEEIVIDKQFSEYGVDSVIGIDLINRMSKKIGITLKTTTLFDYSSVADLTQHIYDQFGKKLIETKFAGLSVAETVVTSPSDELLAQTEELEAVEVHDPIEIYPTQPVVRPTVHSTAVYSASNDVTPASILPSYTDSPYKTIVLERPGHIDDIQIRAFFPKDPGKKEVQILVKSFSINFSDLLCIKGLYPNMPQYPFSPGSEISGVITKIGKGVKELRVRDEVFGFTGEALGGHGYMVNTEARLVIRKPKRITHEAASSFPSVFMTMYYLFEKAMVKKGEKILIQTATGGTGLIAVQLAMQKGAEIFATAGSQEKLDYLKAMGVSHVINYVQNDFKKCVLEMTDRTGVDVVINTLSGDAIQKGIDILAPGGRYMDIAMLGLRSANQIDLSRMTDNQSFYSIDLSRALKHDYHKIRELQKVMVEYLEKGKVKPTIGKIFPFSQVRQAYRYIENRQNIGKIVVTIPDTDSMIKALTPARVIGVIERDIAVIGMACRFPEADTIDEFWKNLSEGKNSITEVPKSRWNIDDYYDPNPLNFHKTHCKFGGFLKDIDKFDPLFFNISGTEAQLTDPQQRLFLEESWNALEDAGYAGQSVSNKKIAVFAGVSSNEYSEINKECITSGPQAFWGNANSILPARISYFLNLKGPSMAIDTACSSSLVAIHLACQSLIEKESDLALAGGIFLTLSPKFHIMASNSGMLASDDRCKTFDNDADGFLPGEGVGVLVLKALSSAIKEKDQIYGVIKGSAINQDGKTNGITTPSTLSQTALEVEVYEKSGIDPSTISYMEAHGTGTKLGDPIEIEALTNAFSRFTSNRNFCAIGSVKTNIGHTAHAAGVAGVIKVLLSLKHKQILPSINFHVPNEHIDFDNSPFYLPTQLKEWATENHIPRRAGVSSFGFSGTNVHIVLEAYEDEPMSLKSPESPLESDDLERTAQLIILSARNEDRLKVHANQIKNALSQTSFSLPEIAYTLSRRESMTERLAFQVSDIPTLCNRLDAYCQGKKMIEGVFQGNIKNGDGKKKSSKDLDALITQRQLRSLAALWVSGVEIDWPRLYENQRVKQISLPTYPFKRARYWISKQNLPAVTSRHRPLEKLHPLIDRNISDFSEQKYVTRLHADAFFVSDHIVSGNMVLPGVALIEMARAAGALASNGKIRRIRNVVWIQPVTIGDAFLDVHIKVFQKTQDTIDYGIYSEEGILHSQGKLSMGSEDLVKGDYIDITAIQKRCSATIETEEIYQKFQNFGLSYGPTFQVIKMLVGNEKEALSCLELPDVAMDEFNDFVLHPAIMDGALQTSVGLMAENPDSEFYVPFALENVEIMGPLMKKCYSYVSVVDSEIVDDREKKCNIFIVDDSGLVLTKMMNFSARKFKHDEIRNSLESEKFVSDTPEILFFENSWEESDIPEYSETWNHLPDNYLLFDIDEELSLALVKRLKTENESSRKVILIKPGDSFKASDDHVFWIHPGVPEDYTQLVHELHQRSLLPQNVIHLWSREMQGVDANNLSLQLERSIYSLSFFSREFMKQSAKERVKLIYVYSKENYSPHNVGVGSFARTIRLENPNYIYKTLEIDTLSSLPLPFLDVLISEFQTTESVVEVRYENQKRYVKKLRELDL